MVPRRRDGKRSAQLPASPVSSKLIALRVAESPVTGSIGTVAAEQGRDQTLKCEIEPHGPLPERMTATLEGLPNRVSANPLTVSHNDRTMTFSVTLEPTAPVGVFETLVCRLSGTINGDEVSYYVGRGGVLRIESAGALATDDAGRPLSRLEVLRRSKKRLDGENTRTP